MSQELKAVLHHVGNEKLVPMTTHSQLLSNIANLQNQLSVIQQQLSSEMDHHAGFQPVVYRSSVNHSVPLQRPVYNNGPRAPAYHERRPYQAASRPVGREARPVLARSDADRVVVPLSTLLTSGEEVTLKVIVGKQGDGQLQYGTVQTVFDGTNLNVSVCELVPDLVGQSSSKPGELLYKFIDSLLEKGHLKRKFSVAPWKLCTVVRNGVTVTLDDLRKA
jgi:hypothetical protein